MKDQVITIPLHIQPNSSRSEIVGMHGGRLKIKIAAPPVDGKANERLISLLAKSIGVPKASLEIKSGKNSKLKTIRIYNIDKAIVDSFLSRYG